jgi:HlyD family secretion protein
MVEASPVVLGELTEEVRVAGHLRALRKAQVTSRLSGRIAEVLVREGEGVEAGQPLILLESADYAARVRQAEAALEAARARLVQAQTQEGWTDTQVDVDIQRARQALLVAEANTARARAEHEDALRDLARKQDLFRQNAIPRIQLEQAELRARTAREMLDSALAQEQEAREALRLARAGTAQTRMRASDVEAARAAVAQAEAALAAAREDLQDTVLRAPVSGVVVDRQAEPGQAAGGRVLLSLVNNEALELVGTMEEARAAQVRPGTPATVVSSLAPGRSFAGRVAEVVPAADPATHSVRVRIRVEGGRPLIDGAYAQARLVVARHQGPLVGRQALQTRGDETYVMVVSGERVSLRPVRVAFQDPTQAVLSSGVRPGERVVVAGAEGLSDGQRVRLKGASAPEGAP